MHMIMWCVSLVPTEKNPYNGISQGWFPDIQSIIMHIYMHVLHYMCQSYDSLSFET